MSPPATPRRRRVRTTLRRTGRWAITASFAVVVMAWLLSHWTALAYHRFPLGPGIVLNPHEFSLSWFGESAYNYPGLVRPSPHGQIDFPPIYSAHFYARDDWYVSLSMYLILGLLGLLTLIAWRPATVIRRIPRAARWGTAAITLPLFAAALAGYFAEFTWFDRSLTPSLHVQCTAHAIGFNLTIPVDSKEESTRVWGNDHIAWLVILPRIGACSGALTYQGLFAIATITSATLWLLDLAARRQHTRQQRLGLCPKCNYDRTGLDHPAPCPECGSTPATP